MDFRLFYFRVTSDFINLFKTWKAVIALGLRFFGNNYSSM